MRKKFLKVVFLLMVAVILSSSVMISFLGCDAVSKSKIKIDYSVSLGEIKHGASGYLYGMAEPDVPSVNLMSGLKNIIAAVKTVDGVQHPMGDIIQVADTFLSAGGERLFVYMQDIYPDWYYKYKGIEDYTEKVQTMMEVMVSKEYSSKIIYCPFNENDNGEWYGDFKKEEAREKFYKDWEIIYNTIKSYDENATIAGPGYMKYSSNYIEEFVKVTKDRNCMPDMMVWHELSSKSIKEYKSNYENYRAIEKKVGIKELEICISEYGQTIDNGVPGKMLEYIAMFEDTKVNACIAYWRLADNLAELAADNNSPTAAWWLYRWYGNMSGETYKTTNKGGASSLASCNEDEAVVLLGNLKNKAEISLENLVNVFPRSEKLNVRVDYVDFGGLGGECLSPILLKYENIDIDNAKVILEGCDPTKAYKLTIKMGAITETYNESLPQRYEAEDAKILTSYSKKDNLITEGRYAFSDKMVKGCDIEFEVFADKIGLYLLEICYCNGYRNNSNKRTTSKANLSINNEMITELSFANTLSQDTSGKVTLVVSLKDGKNSITLNTTYGLLTYDFIDLTYQEKESFEQVADKAKKTNGYEYLFVTPKEGYYKLETKTSEELTYKNASILVSSTDTVYLEKGVNVFIAEKDVGELTVYASTKKSKEIESYELKGDEFLSAPNQVPSNKEAIIKVNVENEGIYALNIYYSNDEEIGQHDYNVQLVERYAKISVNGQDKTVYFRNTYSEETFCIKTIFVNLASGINTITIINDNSYVWNNKPNYLPNIDYTRITIAKIIEDA